LWTAVYLSVTTNPRHLPGGLGTWKIPPMVKPLCAKLRSYGKTWNQRNGRLRGYVSW
jgi:hypothetical protein